MRRICVLVMLFVVVPAASAEARTCKSADMRYPFMAGGPKTFGVFKLRIDGGGCATARRVAKAWGKKLETSSTGRAPRSAGGFTFTTLKAHAAQTFSERGRRGSTTIRFDYVVPNG
jgi:hypothetical protein